MHRIYFHPVLRDHFPLLQKWLTEPHVKAFYDPKIVWTEELVFQKFASYIEGFKEIDGIKKPIYPFLIYLENQPIGYAQYYNAYDFPRVGYQLSEILTNAQVEDGRLAAMDIFIGEKEWIGKGIGPIAIQKFLQEKVYKQFSTCLVDPDPENQRAIRAYEKAGFVKGPTPLMLCHQTRQAPILIRTGVYGVAISNQKLLVIRQKQGVHKGKFDLPGGGIDPGETIEDALQREFFEEVGMQFNSTTHLCNLTAVTYNVANTIGLQQIGLIYQVEGLCKVENQNVELESNWVCFDQLKHLESTPFLQEILQKYCIHAKMKK